MTKRDNKNLTECGYIMNYEKGMNPLSSKNRVLQFRIELSEILPLIWRRILVPSDSNFWDLHVAIQDSMGWLDYHLHHFEIRGKGKKTEDHIGIPDFEGFEEIHEVLPGWEIPVLDYFNDLGVTARYLYDYGDSWWHTVQLEGYLSKEKKVRCPICIDGARSCPPEDSGGVGGYYGLLDVLADIKNEEYERMRTWVGKDWNPEKFDKSSIKFDYPYKRWKITFLEE